MKVIYSIFSFILGADFEIIKLCPIDFTKQKTRVFMALVVAIVTYVSAMFAFETEMSIGIAIIVFLVYITFLSKSSNASFSKFLVALAVAAFIFLGMSDLAYGGVNYLDINNVEEIVTACIIGAMDLVLCFKPVNFSNGNSNYEKLLGQRNANKQAAAQLLVEERAKAERIMIRNREEVRVKRDADIAEYLSDKKLKSQKSAVDRIVEEWSRGIEKQISNSVEMFCSYDKTQQIKISKEYEDDLNNYVSELLKDKRKEFAKIIVDKWAEEKEKELMHNSDAYIS